jgi:hypothetical protein
MKYIKITQVNLNNNDRPYCIFFWELTTQNLEVSILITILSLKHYQKVYIFLN